MTTVRSGDKDQIITLKALIRQRHLSYENFCREWDRTANDVDKVLIGHYPERAQYDRWLRGELANNRPYPDACKMLEAMFSGWTVESLFLPYLEDGNRRVDSDSGDSPMTDASGGKRPCGRCGLPLSRYNSGKLCQACVNASKKERSAESTEMLIDSGKLAELRRNSGMTQQFLADRAGISKSLVEKIESGRRKSSSLTTLNAIAHALNVSLDTFLEVPSLGSRWMANNQPEELSLLCEEDGAEDSSDVLKRVQKLHKSTISSDIIYSLQENTKQKIAQYEALQHFVITPGLRKQRARIESLLDACGHPAQRKQLFEVAGATSGILGYISVGSSNFALARAYCLEAFQLGDFAGNTNLQAWARGLQSFCEYYAGRYDEALSFANDGLNYARSGPQSVRLTINGKARAMGKLGDSKGVDRAVGEAYELMSLNDVPGGVPSSIAFECYSEAQTASNAATAYVSLALPEKVQHYASLALPEISKSDSPWSRSLVMIDLAVSQVRAANADLDYASTLVSDALAISADRPVISVQQRASEFVLDVVNRWGDVPQARMIRDVVFASTERGN